MSSYEHFTVVETAPGVHAALAGKSGAAVSNSAIIDTGSKTVVVDTFMTTQAAAELRAAVRDLTGRDTFLVVNTHWHGDHVRGNQAFAGLPIVSTARTLELIVADSPTDLSAYEEEIDGYLATFRQKLQSDDQAERALAERRIAGLEQIKASVPGYRLTLPDVLIDGRLVIEDERTVEIVTFGAGHTDSDVFAWLPQERAVAAGDLCWNAVHPKIEDGHPADWAAVLDRLLALDPQHVIPGHGRAGGKEIVAAMLPYMHAVTDLLDEVRAGADPATVDVPAGSEAWDGPARLHGGLAILRDT
ncbi:MAG TPA: MBL fold metallo-hydrolase [Acidimicrobiia bacterium]|nr:MBL fold metallo-hydrolase [Acidimicrobiia bacterium]